MVSLRPRDASAAPSPPASPPGERAGAPTSSGRGAKKASTAAASPPASPARRRAAAGATAAAPARRAAGAVSPTRARDSAKAQAMLAALRAAFGEEEAAPGGDERDEADDDGSASDGGASTSSSDDEEEEGGGGEAGAAAGAHPSPTPLKTWRPSLRLPRPPKAAAATAALAATATPAPGANAPLGAEGRLATLPAPTPPGPSASKAAAAAWFALPTPPGGVLTAEQKRDLRLLRLRGALDPTRHYRSADSTKLPSRFAIGTVIEGAGEWHSARLDRKARGRTLADELLADAGLAAVRKRRFGALQAEAGRWAGKKGSKPTIGGAPRLKKRKPKPKH